MQPTGKFHAEQRAYFERADRERFEWTTSGPGFSEVEDEVLAPFLAELAPPCLEIGCGEGNNLVRLRRRGRCFGIDLFPAKLVFAAQQLPEVGFAAADAAALPFPQRAFASVFIRDLLHHVGEPRAVLEEAVRVLAPGGRLCLLEPNGRNPLAYVQSLVVSAERGIRGSDERRIRALLDGLPLEGVRVWPLQPLPLRRLLLHYKIGFPSLARNRTSLRALIAVERALGRLLPPSRWIYVAARATRVAG